MHTEWRKWEPERKVYLPKDIKPKEIFPTSWDCHHSSIGVRCLQNTWCKSDMWFDYAYGYLASREHEENPSLTRVLTLCNTWVIWSNELRWVSQKVNLCFRSHMLSRKWNAGSQPEQISLKLSALHQLRYFWLIPRDSLIQLFYGTIITFLTETSKKSLHTWKIYRQTYKNSQAISSFWG